MAVDHRMSSHTVPHHLHNHKIRFSCPNKLKMTDASDKKSKLQPYFEMLERLRQEPFHQETIEKLNSHAYILAAQHGSLTITQRRAFVCEQLAVQQSDAASFAFLAGHVGFCPKSLADAILPTPIIHNNKQKEHGKSPPVPDLFQFLLGGELYASSLLLDLAKSLDLENESAIRAWAPQRPCSARARAQAYPSYWARLALQGQHGAGAAACAVNFPAWGSMCRKLHTALSTREEYGYSNSSSSKTDLAFIDFFATPIDNLDEMAATIMYQHQVKYNDLVEPTRLLQEYEIMFWDAVFDEE